MAKEEISDQVVAGVMGPPHGLRSIEVQIHNQYSTAIYFVKAETTGAEVGWKPEQEIPPNSAINRLSSIEPGASSPVREGPYGFFFTLNIQDEEYHVTVSVPVSGNPKVEPAPAKAGVFHSIIIPPGSNDIGKPHTHWRLTVKPGDKPTR